MNSMQGLDHVFFTMCGSTAVDTALKIALAYHRSVTVIERRRSPWFPESYRRRERGGRLRPRTAEIVSFDHCLCWRGSKRGQRRILLSRLCPKI